MYSSNTETRLRGVDNRPFEKEKVVIVTNKVNGKSKQQSRDQHRKRRYIIIKVLSPSVNTWFS